MEAYSSWHETQLAALQRDGADCKSVKSIVWEPQAGLGDAAFSLQVAFDLALKTGRMLFVDWKMSVNKGTRTTISWDAVLTPPFKWDVHEAIQSGAICPSKSPSQMTAYMIDMDIRAPNYAVLMKEQHASPAKSVVFSEDAMILFLLRPSAKVRDEYMAQTEELLSGSYVISVAMRTGHFEYTGARFLDLGQGDELQFAECANAAIRQLKPHFASVLPNGVKVFASSDNQQAIDSFKAAAGEYGWADRVVTMPSTGVISHVNSNSSDVHEDGIYRAFAEFFLLGRAHVSFLTAHSLFGDAAANRAAGGAAAGKLGYLYPADSAGSDGTARYAAYGGTLSRRYFVNKRGCKDVDPTDLSSMTGIHFYDTCKPVMQHDYGGLELGGGCQAVLHAVVQKGRGKCPWRPMAEVEAEDVARRKQEL
jgi:hypothetical protein